MRGDVLMADHIYLSGCLHNLHSPDDVVHHRQQQPLHPTLIELSNVSKPCYVAS